MADEAGNLSMAHKRSTKWDEAASAGENARAQLPAVAGAYFQAGRKLLKGSPAPEDLHGFRLKTKRLRYTLELFRTCYSSTLEERLEALREIQTLLGDINDCTTALRVAADVLPARSLARRKAERFLRARFKQLSGAFSRHWKQKFDAPGREDWWVGYLARRKTSSHVPRNV
jgi:CHAD domain-containing protein